MKNLIFLRKKFGFSQAELGEKVGFGQRAISKWENNDAEPDIATLKKLADIFKCSIDELVGNFDDQQKEPDLVEFKEKEELTEEQKRCVEILKTMTPKQVEQTYYFLLGLSERSLEIMKKE